jgi:hypothetical protein
VVRKAVLAAAEVAGHYGNPHVHYYIKGKKWTRTTTESDAPKGSNPDKLHRCVRKVARKGGVRSAWAVCRRAVGNPIKEQIYHFAVMNTETAEPTGENLYFQAAAEWEAVNSALYAARLKDKRAVKGPTGRVVYPHGPGSKVAWVLKKQRFFGNPGLKHEPAEVRELVLFTINDGDLYRQQVQPIILNLARKVAKGVYNANLAAKLWGYLAESGARKYAKEFSVGTDWARMFPPEVRRAAARKFLVEYQEAVRDTAAKMRTLRAAGVAWTHPPARGNPISRLRTIPPGDPIKDAYDLGSKAGKSARDGDWAAVREWGIYFRKWAEARKGEASMDAMRNAYNQGYKDQQPSR